MAGDNFQGFIVRKGAVGKPVCAIEELNRADLPAGEGTVAGAYATFKHKDGLAGERAPGASAVLEARGLVVLPGAIDTHTHHRDPGYTHKEDITTATCAAAAGGVKTSIGMPNDDPPTNSVVRQQAVVERSRR